MRTIAVWFTAAAILFLAVGLRTWNLASESPGYQEIAASLAAMRSCPDYLRFPQLDRCPPLSYLALHPLALMGYGHSIAMMRLPSVFLGALACMLLFLLGRRAIGDRAAAAAALLLAINPLHVYFSQEVQPSAFATLLIIAVFCMLILSSRTYSVWHWAIYDVLAVALMYEHPDGQFVLGGFLILHLVKAIFFREPDEQRRLKRGRLVGTVLINYAAIIALSAPWLAIMGTRIPWFEARPKPAQLLQTIGHTFSFGLLGRAETVFYIVLAIGYALLLPPVIKMLKQRVFAPWAVLLGILLILGIPFGYSYIGRIRFAPTRTGILVIPLFMMFLGVAVGRCNAYMRLVFTALIGAVFLFATARQSYSSQKVDWRKMAATVEHRAAPKEVVVFWPDYTTMVGEYFFGDKYQVVSATDFFEKWVDMPSKGSTFFVISQFPSRTGHLYTFPGALKHYSDSEVLWSGDKLNMVVRATDLRLDNLRMWYRQPDKLNILDQPTSETQFIFTPENKVFQDKQFHWDQQDLCYDLDGRRAVWTRNAFVSLRLPVMLSPGAYVLKLHCSPAFERPELGINMQRTVNVQWQTGNDVKHVQIDKETTIRVPFSIDVEMRVAPAHLNVSPLLKSGNETFGVKIYSIAIDQVGAAETS